MNIQQIHQSIKTKHYPGAPGLHHSLSVIALMRYPKKTRMSQATLPIRFETRLLRPATTGKEGSWNFIVLPAAASEMLPRRGRTTVAGTLNGHPFQATLEPDGQLGHWLRVDRALSEAAALAEGGVVAVEIVPVVPEPEPAIPADLSEALAACPPARSEWEATTTLARLDWIHWISSAKQPKTRERRIHGACEMLASGKRRVCCFDPSGFYSKAFRAPDAAD